MVVIGLTDYLAKDILILTIYKSIEMYNFFYFSIGLLAALVDTVRFPQQKSAPSRVELVSSPLDLTQPIAGPTDQSHLDD